ncbi:MAG: helix-turn-helix domain-containing protein [Actinomycetes bacterium]
MPERWVGTREVAEHLGKPVSWVYNEAANLGIPRVKMGHQYRYRLSEVDGWMERLRSEVSTPPLQNV